MSTQPNNQVEDLFLKALIKNDGLKTPSKDFTAMVMSRLPKAEKLVVESTKMVGKNITFLIFGLVAIINLIVLFFLWPYLSVWIPDNSLISIILDNANSLITQYALTFFSRSATLGLLIIIATGGYFLLENSVIKPGLQKISRRISF
jgi:hypothetical protein